METTNATKPEDRRKAERRISPAIGEFAVQECARLREDLNDARSGWESAAEEVRRLDDDNARLREGLAHWQRMYECAQNANALRDAALAERAS